VWSRDAEELVSGIRNLLRVAMTGPPGGLSKGDLNTGWYQGLVVIDEDGAPGVTALLAGHQGSVIELKL
jgi:hypothetical protein